MPYLQQEWCIFALRCEYLPCVFGVSDRKLTMRLIICDDNKVVKVSSMQKENKLTSADWNVTCFSLVSAVKYMRFENLLHFDLNSNNIFSKLRNNVWIPKLADMGKVTSKYHPVTCKVSNKQRDC